MTTPALATRGAIERWHRGWYVFRGDKRTVGRMGDERFSARTCKVLCFVKIVRARSSIIVARILRTPYTRSRKKKSLPRLSRLNSVRSTDTDCFVCRIVRQQQAGDFYDARPVCPRDGIVHQRNEPFATFPA